MGGRGIGKGDERDQSVLYICMTLSKNRLIKNFNCFPFSKKNGINYPNDFLFLRSNNTLKPYYHLIGTFL